MTFDDFWANYPRKVGKKDARKVWSKLKMNHTLFNQISENIKQRISSGDWSDIRFIPHPGTYLRGERWDDEVYQLPAVKQEKSFIEKHTDRSWRDDLTIPKHNSDWAKDL